MIEYDYDKRQLIDIRRHQYKIVTKPLTAVLRKLVEQISWAIFQGVYGVPHLFLYTKIEYIQWKTHENNNNKITLSVYSSI